MLQVRNLTVSYGAISAVRGIDLDISSGEIVTLIGANGAGKTTVARAIAGLLSYQGDILHSGQLLKPDSAERNLRLPEARELIEKALKLAPADAFMIRRWKTKKRIATGIVIKVDAASFKG